MMEMRYANTDVLTLLAIPITDVLVGLGYSDKHVKEMYYSPFRNETSPSFHINHRCNIWYDQYDNQAARRREARLRRGCI